MTTSRDPQHQPRFGVFQVSASGRAFRGPRENIRRNFERGSAANDVRPWSTTNERMSNLTIRISPKLKRQIRKVCTEQNRPVSDLVRESIRRYIAQEQLRAVREQLRPYAEARGVMTDDDVFQTVL